MHPILTLVPRPAAPPEWSRALALTEVLTEHTPARPWTLPGDPELMLRSALGRALFEIACTRPETPCAGCDLRTTCEIPGWYAPERLGGGDRPRPILPGAITPPGAYLAPDAPLRVRWWLLGPAPRAGLLVEALVRLGRMGLGPDRVEHRLTRVAARGEGGLAVVIDQDQERGRWPQPGHLGRWMAAPDDVQGAEIAVRTPLSWAEARPDRRPTVGDLLWAALGRLRQSVRAQGQPQPPPWADPRVLDRPWAEARWVRDRRWPSGGGVQDLSGWVGHVVMGPEVQPWVDLLAAAEVLGAGGGGSAGRGALRVHWRG